MAGRWRRLPGVRALGRCLRRGLDPLVDQRIGELSRRNDPDGRPNLHELAQTLKQIEALRTNVKAFGQRLARAEAERNGLGRKVPEAPPRVGLVSQACTQADLESEWAAYWLDRMRQTPVYRRRLWERCYVLQALSERVPAFWSGGARGLGFGCGREPIASVLAGLGHELLLTDLPPEESERRGWLPRDRLARLEDALREDVVGRAEFDARVSLRHMDMTRIDRDLEGRFDFCWSVCAFEHLGSLEAGKAFVEASLDVLRPGGVAVHTTEFSYANDEETVDHWQTVLYRRRDLTDLAARLEARGFEVAPLDFDVGDGPMDAFVDVPPYRHDVHELHLKISVDGFPCTAFGLIVRRPEAA
jgi:SAM-dependent methyltransferase